MGYKKDLRDLQIALVRYQQWVIKTGAKALIIFEGRDGLDRVPQEGGVIERRGDDGDTGCGHVAEIPKLHQRSDGRMSASTVFLRKWNRPHP